MSGPATVVHVIETDGLYGAERVVLELCQQSRLQGRFTPVVVALPGGSAQEGALGAEARAAGFRVVEASLRRHALPADVFTLVRAVRRIAPAVIHCHGTKPALLGPLLRRATGGSLVATCHLWFAEPTDRGLFALLQRLEKRMYTRFDAVVAVSPSIADVLGSVIARPVIVIPNGVEVRARRASESAADGDAGPIVLLNLARLAAQKNQSALIRALAGLLTRGIDAHLRIAGEGPRRAALEQQAAELGVVDRVALLGFRTDGAHLLQEADIFVLPSLDEGLPMSLLEAMAHGLPVIATPVGSVAEVLGHGAFGTLVPVGDDEALLEALITLCRSRELRQRSGARARQRVLEDYSSEAMWRRYAEVYDDVLASGSPSTMGSRDRDA